MNCDESTHLDALLARRRSGSIAVLVGACKLGAEQLLLARDETRIVNSIASQRR